MRQPLPPPVVEQIRRERTAPRWRQCDYLHLASLLRGLRRTFDAVPVADGPVLDLYCGTAPYQAIIPWRPIWGYDIDRHFGAADVVGSLPLPFRDRAFAAVVCTQALYLVEDAAAVVCEMRRVLAPGAYAIVSVPNIFRRETDMDRRFSRGALQALFAEWEAVDIARAGGAGTGGAYYLGRLMNGAAARSVVVRRVLPGIAAAMNGSAALLDLVLDPLLPRVAASFILTARRPAG